MSGEIHKVIESDLLRILEIEQSNQLFPYSLEKLQSCLSDDYINLVVCDDTTVVGFVLCLIGFDYLEIHNICICNKHRRKGLARQLITELIRRAKERNLYIIQLEVRSTNLSAISLYESLGFITVGRRKNYYKADNGRYEDALLMDLAI